MQLKHLKAVNWRTTTFGIFEMCKRVDAMSNNATCSLNMHQRKVIWFHCCGFRIELCVRIQEFKFLLSMIIADFLSIRNEREQNTNVGPYKAHAI